MRINDRQTLLRAFDNQKAESTAQTQQTNKTVSELAISALDRALAGIPSANTQRSQFTQGTQRQFPKGDVLPPSMSPPTPERVNQAVDDAYLKFSQEQGKSIFPTGAQRTELRKLGEQMVAQGKSAHEVELAITDKLRAEAQGIPSQMSQADIDKKLKDVFTASMQSNFPGWSETNHPPGSEKIDQKKWMDQARDMVKNNRDFKTIKYALTDGIALDRQGLSGKPNAETLNKLFEQAMQSNWPEWPAGGDHGIDRAEWMKTAQQMADDNQSAKSIRYALTDGISAKRQGLDIPQDPTQLALKLNQIVDAALESNFIDPKKASAKDREDLFNKAKEMVAANKDLKSIKYALTDMMTPRRQGLEHTDTDTLKRLVTDAFQASYGRAPDANEMKEWLDKAKDMAGDGADAKSIKYAMNDGVRAHMQGVDKTDDASLQALIINSFAKVYEGQPHNVSQNEMNAWFKLAKEMAEAGKDAKTIGYAITDGLRTSIQNQVHLPGEPNAYR